MAICETDYARSGPEPRTCLGSWMLFVPPNPLLHNGTSSGLCPWLASEEATEHRPITFRSEYPNESKVPPSHSSDVTTHRLVRVVVIFPAGKHAALQLTAIASAHSSEYFLHRLTKGAEKGRRGRRHPPGLFANVVCVDRLTRQSLGRAAKSGPLCGGHLPSCRNRTRPLPSDFLRRSCVANIDFGAYFCLVFSLDLSCHACTKQQVEQLYN